MKTRQNTGIDYQALAGFRYAIRRFQILSEQAARASGIEPQQFQALLAIKGLPDSGSATVGALADRLQIQHHSAVELADRLEAHRLLKRIRSRADRREVILRLTNRGEEILRRVALPRREELRAAARSLLRSLEAVVNGAGRGAGIRARQTQRDSALKRHKN